MFKQRWISKRLLMGYHVEGIMGVKKFTRWYLPSLLPSIHADHDKKAIKARNWSKWVEGKESAGGRYRDQEEAAKKAERATVPVGSMMFAFVERRLDVCIFRACLAQSVYQAKQFVTKGHVKLNGQVVSPVGARGHTSSPTDMIVCQVKNSATELRPGDIFTVNWKVVEFVRPPTGQAFINKDLNTMEEVEEGTMESEATDDQTSDPVSTSPDSSNPSNSSSSPDSSPISEPTESSTSSSSSTESPAESSASSSPDTTSTSSPASSPSTSPSMSKSPKSHFTLPPFAQASIFVPAYLLPNYLTCSAVYVRHPTARLGYSEIPTPFDAGGDLMALGWEWFHKRAPRMRRGRVQRWWDPQRTKDRLAQPWPRD